MSLDEDNVKARIERIHRNKHNMIPVVKLVVLHPIDSLMSPDALTKSVPDSVTNRLSEIKQMAESIMNELKNFGSVQSDNPNTQLLQLEEQISSIGKNVIPKILEIVAFYQELDEKGYYFAPTPSGGKAKDRVIESIKYKELVCDGLQTLDESGKPAETASCNLYQIIESVFEGGFEYLNVEYFIDNRNKSYCLNLDVNMFSQKVLSNIKWNIQSHAFPESKYKNILITEQKVRVKILDETSFVKIIIDNNGEPFEGDITKVFDYGYCHGPYRHTGLGLNSAKMYMTSIGGDLTFQAVPDSDFKVKYEITIKKASINV